MVFRSLRHRPAGRSTGQENRRRAGCGLRRWACLQTGKCAAKPCARCRPS